MLAVAVTDPVLTDGERINRFTEAETLMLEGNGTLQPDASADRKSKRDSLTLILCLYEAWGKPEKAAERRDKLAGFHRSGVETEMNATPPNP